MTATEELHGILLHLRLVVFYPAYLLAVGSEHHRRVGHKLLLIHPVGHSVDYLIKFSVLRHLALGIVVEQFDEIDIVLPYECYHRAVGRKDRSLLRSGERQCHHLVVAHVEDIVFCSKRAAIDCLCGGLNEDIPSVGTDDISIHPVDAYLRPSHVVEVEHCSHLLTGFEGVFHNFSLVR